MRKERNGAGFVSGPEIVEFGLVAFEWDGQIVIDDDLGLRRATKLEYQPVARINGHKADRRSQRNSPQPSLHGGSFSLELPVQLVVG